MRSILRYVALIGCSLVGGGLITLFGISFQEPITRSAVEQAELLIGIRFVPAERDSMLENLSAFREHYDALRKLDLPNDLPFTLKFDPVPSGFSLPDGSSSMDLVPLAEVTLPDDREALAYYSIRQLAGLIRSRRISSLELTEFFIARLKKFDPKLKCVITLTEDRALERAKEMDAELAKNEYRGLLHGIPYGIKDLFSVAGYKTTWGARPYVDQVLPDDAEIVKMLEDAGAILIAKLSLGALAWGDVWYGGKTRNPWNLEQGSSGSSAGSAAATAAGLVPFAIGTETWGSIVSPSTRCGVTGLRPTYGRIDARGGMVLSWSMDKPGPICRSAEDCALVFDALLKPIERFGLQIDVPFNFDETRDLKKLRVGYLKSAFDEKHRGDANDQAVLDVIASLGVELIPVSLPDLPVGALSFILEAEAGAAFDELTRSNRDSLLVRQIKNSWPNVFRSARFISAVEYIQANRVRSLLIDEMEKMFAEIDVYVAPSFGGDNLLLTNLTGHPCAVVPNGFDEGSPTSISFIGRLYDEGTVLDLAYAYQQSTEHHKAQPPLFR